MLDSDKAAAFWAILSTTPVDAAALAICYSDILQSTPHLITVAQTKAMLAIRPTLFHLATPLYLPEDYENPTPLPAEYTCPREVQELLCQYVAQAIPEPYNRILWHASRHFIFAAPDLPELLSNSKAVTVLLRAQEDFGPGAYPYLTLLARAIKAMDPPLPLQELARLLAEMPQLGKALIGSLPHSRPSPRQ